MIQRKRRSLFTAAIAALGMAVAGVRISWRRRTPQRCDIQLASAFFGPYLTSELEVGKPLELAWKDGIAYVLFREKPLGLLPLSIADALEKTPQTGMQPHVRLAHIGRDASGRLVLAADIT